MKNLKTLKIKDLTLLYEIVHYDCGEYGTMICGKTVFYNPRPIIKTRKKYWLCGPEIKYTEYEHLFTIAANIESHDLLKKDITKMLNKEIALLNRKEEIKRGEIIETEEDAKTFVEAITNPPAPNDKLKEAAATHPKKYTDKDMTNFVSFVGKNYIKAKGFYFMKGDFEKKHKLSIHQILEEFKKKNLEVKK
jgi:uncharacterized protein (DUF1778 family)